MASLKYRTKNGEFVNIPIYVSGGGSGFGAVSSVSGVSNGELVKVKITSPNNDGTGDVVISCDVTELKDILDAIYEYSVNGLKFNDNGDKDIILNASNLPMSETDTTTIADKISQMITGGTAGVSQIQINDQSNYVKLNVSPADGTGIVTLSIDDSSLTDASLGGGITSVGLGTNGSKVQLTIDTNNNEVKIGLNDSQIVDLINGITNNYIKSFQGENGEITINTTVTDPGSVQFSMDGKQLNGVVQGLTSTAYSDLQPYSTTQMNDWISTL